jgi:hypothetical protein
MGLVFVEIGILLGVILPKGNGKATLHAVVMHLNMLTTYLYNAPLYNRADSGWGHVKFMLNSGISGMMLSCMLHL